MSISILVFKIGMSVKYDGTALTLQIPHELRNA